MKANRGDVESGLHEEANLHFYIYVYIDKRSLGRIGLHIQLECHVFFENKFRSLAYSSTSAPWFEQNLQYKYSKSVNIE